LPTGSATRSAPDRSLRDRTALLHGPFFLASSLKCLLVFMVALRAGTVGTTPLRAVAERVVVSGPTT
jgi:hypothetical protein